MHVILNPANAKTNKMTRLSSSFFAKGRQGQVLTFSSAQQDAMHGQVTAMGVCRDATTSPRGGTGGRISIAPRATDGCFVHVLAGVRGRFNWRIHVYCLMTNHYHLLVDTPDGNLAKGMGELNGAYTQRFNRICARVGHIFQGL